MRPGLFGWLVGAVLCTTPAMLAAAPTEGEPYRYLAVLDGACERLMLAGRDETAGCAPTLVNVDFGDGRVAFAFTSPTETGAVITTFLGHASAQPDLRTYRLEVDEIATLTRSRNGEPTNIAERASGHCVMRGDPTREPARFECTATRGAAHTRAVFVSAGNPRVHAGGRSGLAAPTSHASAE